MQPFRLDFKFLTSSILATSTILTSLLLANVTYANEDDTELKKACNRQSLITVAKIRDSSSNEMTEQDIRMLKLGANHACMDIRKRMINSNAGTSPDNKVIAKTDDTKNQETKNQETKSEKSESIFDRLLSSERKPDVSPMQKRHRTGGK